MDDVFTFSAEINKRIWDLQADMVALLPGGGCLEQLDIDLQNLQAKIDDFRLFIDEYESVESL